MLLVMQNIIVQHIKNQINVSLVWLVLEATGISLDSVSLWNRGGIHSKCHQHLVIL